MPRKRRTEEQIIYAVKQAEAGKKATEICLELCVSDQAFYTWKRRYRGLGVQELREENHKLKYVVADLTLDRHILQEIVAKKLRRRVVAAWAQAHHVVSQRRAARLLPIDRGTLRWVSQRDPQLALCRRLRELAGVRARFGYRRLM